MYMEFQQVVKLQSSSSRVGVLLDVFDDYSIVILINCLDLQREHVTCPGDVYPYKGQGTRIHVRTSGGRGAVKSPRGRRETGIKHIMGHQRRCTRRHVCLLYGWGEQ